jgi:hypothetical protein
MSLVSSGRWPPVQAGAGHRRAPIVLGVFMGYREFRALYSISA